MSRREIAAQVGRLLKTGETAEARALAERALSLAPHDATAHNVMALVETAEHRHDKARLHCQAAVVADPQNPHLRVDLAYSLIIAGEFDAAREELARALTLDPALASAYQHLVWITKVRDGDPIIETLRRLKDAPGLDDRTFAIYAYALGKCYDDIGEYDLAFECYKAANDRQVGGYDRAAQERRFADIKRVWNAEFIEERRRRGFACDKPAIIVGMLRSGSSLLEARLASRPDVVALGERTEIVRIAASIERNHPLRAPYPFWGPDLPKEAFAGFGRIYVDRMSAESPAAARFIDKNLVNFAYVGMIRAMLPDALILESRRSPIDVCLSCYFSNLVGRHAYAHDLADLGHYCRLYMDLMNHWRDAGADVIVVDYERFIEDPEGWTRRLHAAMGLGETSAEGAAHRAPIATFSAFQARQAVYHSSVSRWRNYEKHLAPLLEALGDVIR
jgi:hypothetical protein